MQQLDNNIHSHRKEHLLNSWETFWKEPLPHPWSSLNHPTSNCPKIPISQRCQKVIASQSAWDMTLIWNQTMSCWVTTRIWLMTKNPQWMNVIEIGSHLQRESKGDLMNLFLSHGWKKTWEMNKWVEAGSSWYQKAPAVLKDSVPRWRQRSAVILSMNNPVPFANGGEKWPWGCWGIWDHCRKSWICKRLGWSPSKGVGTRLDQTLWIARVHHIKVFTLLSDPAVCAELQSYVRSNKWALNPAKLVAFTWDELIPAKAEKYAHQIIDKEVPVGLKKYLEVELFPCIHLKVGNGISLSTAHWWLHWEGFRYMKYKKGLYYDGHDQPDILDYCWNQFLPAMQQYQSRLVEYKIREVETKIIKQSKPGERRLVLVAHDESTMQANDGEKEGWVLDGEHPLQKKGVGRGLHQSDVICSTYGWLKGASVTMEYGKNYDGYWTGKLFVKQVCKFGLNQDHSHKCLAALWENHSWIRETAWSWVSGINYGW